MRHSAHNTLVHSSDPFPTRIFITGQWEIDLLSDTIRCSPEVDEIFGQTRSYFSWRLNAALNRFVSEDRSSVRDELEQARSTGSIEFEKRIRRVGDGALRWVHVKGYTSYADGKPVRMAGEVIDVTEWRLSEDRRRDTEKMEAIRRLCRRLSHDYNNLLMVINANLEMLNEQAEHSPKALRFFTAARDGVDRGAQLNHKLSVFAAPREDSNETVNIGHLLLSLERPLRDAVGEAIEVRLIPGAIGESCKADAQELKAAILSLAINAREAMVTGGVLTISTLHRRITKDFAQTLGIAPGDYLVVSVSDSGVGIGPDIAARVFEPLFTTKRGGTAKGLGLSQVYGFARQSGGFVTIESELSHGTTIFLHLPLSPTMSSTAYL
ncbi:PAS domain-containing hybrid sensor histidine kinase/response regulator [Candidimonas sp. SYP-B2681]|uniref:PAS domain-containing hybrid sensor histidine kinase/response regulator n=1 Tax=Candidimonas sp. SYP-B2681 TaxID=2497686 RepID=UPI000F897FBD|nr:PAS domain-containing hybrid sensor histidine kinase/response regulator [Candidimonas sp. SYP-B2681]RTZ45575.1 PAS domain-containing hybrid sensor histidine kinase/response regulator [Candidimonas sp. SYP-B2681]